MDDVTRAVQAALDRDGATSLRAIARAAGVPHSTLSKIRHGTLRATPAVAHAVARVLEAWAVTYRTHARAIRATLPRRRA